MRLPNILLVMSDQHHAGIMGCAGDPLVRTPHLDRLAAAGARFSSTYCPFPLCGPSRMSFMTCRHPVDTEVWSNERRLHGNIPTFAHGLAVAGYDTLISGRMHFVGPDQLHGFRHRLIADAPESVHIEAGWKLGDVLGCLRDTPGHGQQSVAKSGPGWSGYLEYDTRVADVTEAWLRQRPADSDSPFLMVAGLVLPHCPFVAPKEDFDYYASRISWDNLPEPDPNLHPHVARWRQSSGVDPAPPREAQWRARAAYCGMVTYMDRQIGRLLDTLDETGLADNTIVIYTSDHGEMLGEHGLWWKSTFYDGASRVPLLWRAPGQVAPGTVIPRNVGLVDIGATLLDIAGAPPLPNVAGRSFRPLLEGRDDWHDTVFVEHTNRGTAATPVSPCRFVRQGPWKFCYYHGQDAQLFNLEDDPGETTDRAGDPACRDVVERLRALVLSDWDPDFVIRRLERSGEEQALFANYLRRNPLPEPDPIWFGDTPPENHFEPVSYDQYH